MTYFKFMNIAVTPYPSALKKVTQEDKIIIVIDVLRACTTIVQAFSNECKAFYPVPSVKKARELKASSGDLPSTQPFLLGGERKGRKIKGFDLGNSPLEYTADVVRDKYIIFTTSNCTKNLDSCKHPKETLICSFLNIRHVVNYLSRLGDDIVIALSGREGDFSLEDAVCAGMLIDMLPPFNKGGIGGIGDLGQLCRTSYLYYKNNIIDALANSTHGKILTALGFEEDIKFCARTGDSKVLPRYLHGKISCTH